MEKMDFRPPILRNIGNAFASPVTWLSAVCFLLAAVLALISLPLQIPVLALCGGLAVLAMLIFGLYAAAKRKRGMRPAAARLFGLFCFAGTLVVLAVGGIALFWPAVFPKEAVSAVFAAARIDTAYTAGVFWVLLGLAALCLFGFGLLLQALGRTLKDGIPRRGGIGFLCTITLITVAVYGALGLCFTLGRAFDAVVHFERFLPYNFIPALPTVFFILGTDLFCTACLRYGRAVKRSSNV
ncbi:MAG: hypothetical protein IJW78_03630 [Clostridia bacterium]|nr:hypothetical protein [Clostridia bacterium]